MTSTADLQEEFSKLRTPGILEIKEELKNKDDGTNVQIGNTIFTVSEELKKDLDEVIRIRTENPNRLKHTKEKSPSKREKNQIKRKKGKARHELARKIYLGKVTWDKKKGWIKPPQTKRGRTQYQLTLPGGFGGDFVSSESNSGSDNEVRSLGNSGLRTTGSGFGSGGNFGSSRLSTGSDGAPATGRQSEAAETNVPILRLRSDPSIDDLLRALKEEGILILEFTNTINGAGTGVAGDPYFEFSKYFYIATATAMKRALGRLSFANINAACAGLCTLVVGYSEPSSSASLVKTKIRRPTPATNQSRPPEKAPTYDLFATATIKNLWKVIGDNSLYGNFASANRELYDALDKHHPQSDTLQQFFDSTGFSADDFNNSAVPIKIKIVEEQNSGSVISKNGVADSSETRRFETCDRIVISAITTFGDLVERACPLLDHVIGALKQDFIELANKLERMVNDLDEYGDRSIFDVWVGETAKLSDVNGIPGMPLLLRNNNVIERGRTEAPILCINSDTTFHDIVNTTNMSDWLRAMTDVDAKLGGNLKNKLRNEREYTVMSVFDDHGYTEEEITGRPDIPVIFSDRAAMDLAQTENVKDERDRQADIDRISDIVTPEFDGDVLRFPVLNPEQIAWLHGARDMRISSDSHNDYEIDSNEYDAYWNGREDKDHDIYFS